MKILVLMKRVLDCSRQVSIDEQNGVVRVEGARLPMMDNPADLAALELAMRLKQTAPGSSVTALSLGGEEAADILINALAYGADRAIQINSGGASVGPKDSFQAAYVLAKAIKVQNSDLVLCGTKSFDTGSSQLGGLISQFLQLSHISAAVRVEVSSDQGFISVNRKLEKGRKLVLRCPLPALIAVEPSVAEPKYISLYRQMKVDRNLIEQIPLDSLNVSPEQPALTEIVRVMRTKPRAKKSAFSAASLSPLERMKLMTGQQNSERGKLVEGNRDTLVREIISYLEQNKIISGSGIS